MRVSIIGQGYVGLPLAIASASAGHEVLGVDTNKVLIEKLNTGKSPIVDISDKEISHALSSKHYLASTDLTLISTSEIIVICVPTPIDVEQKPDLTLLKSALKSVADNMQDNTLVIVESTISPGTTRGLISSILKSSGVKYELAYSPERIDPANTEWNVTNTPKLLAGLTPNATKKAREFYQSFVKEVIAGESVEVIETAKLLENTFRLINISFINELAEFCWKMKIDVREVIKAATSKPYGFMPFYPGAGVGGHCIPVDPSYLSEKARELGAGTSFIDLANKINQNLPTYFANVVLEILGEITGKKILIVGVAYKPNVADTRETPALGLIQSFRTRGAEVSWHDQLVGEWMGEKSAPLSSDYDLAILVNVHTDMDLSHLQSTKILDVRGGYL
jgi:UDP-N-acetyl-D-glucosamine dehydrogenase